MPNHVKPGDPLAISPHVYNYAVDLYERSNGAGATSEFIRQRSNDTRILIRNSTGQSLPRFSVVGLGGPHNANPPTLSAGLAADGTNGDYSNEFFESPILIASNPPSAAPSYKWGVTQEAIGIGEIGECLISGLTLVKLDSPQGPAYADFATPNAVTTNLIGAKCSMCRVIWRNANGGPQWSIVNIG